MKSLIVLLTTLTTFVAGEQPPNNYNNDFHNRRYHEDKIVSTPEKGFDEQDRNYPIITGRGSTTFNFEDYQDYESHEGLLVDTIPGKAGKDFPAYTSVPKTSFTCKGRNTGYFADPETDCQVFHICTEGGQKISFLCPNGSIFNQKVSVCDWWYDVDCLSSSELIDSNDIQKNRIYNEPSNDYNQYQHFIVESEPYYDLALASSGGNQNPKHESKTDKSSKGEQDGKKKVVNSAKSRNLKSSTSSSVKSEDRHTT